MITREFDLMLYQEGNLLFINANQYDSGEQWIFTLYEENGVKYTPATGAIVGVKSDGKGIINTGTVDEYGRVVINETQQMTAAAGLATFELLIDNDTHGTANFKVDVEPRPADNADLSDSDLSLIQEAIDSAAEIEDLLGGQDVPTVITPIISDWLDDNITNPSNPPIDTSLTVAGAAADAKVTGDEITDLKSAISTDDVITWNQLSPAFTRASGNLAGVTYTRSSDQKQAVFNGTPTRTDFFQLIQSGLGTSVAGHKYAIFTPRVSGSSSGYWFFYLNSRNVRDIGNGAIWTADSATNIVVGIEWNTSNNLPTFNNLTVNLPIITDLTACFGAGNEPTIEEFRAMFPNDSYPKNTGTQRELTRCEKNALDIYHNTIAVAKTQSSVKLKILTFNCGHYNYGSSSEYAGDDMQDKIVEWKKMLAKYKPDIMLGQEMSLYFDAAQTVQAIDTIFKPLLPNFYYSNFTKMVSKYPFTNRWQQTITVVVGGTTYTRPLTCALININGVDIALCSVHLPAGYSASDTAVREAMRDELIAAFENYEHVILAGDYNESTDSFFAPFESAGYSLGNHGYFGTIETLPNESVDNIIVKGFTFYDAISNSADACTSDHYPFASEIHII